MSESPSSVGMFPFGQPACALQQQDRTQKRVFVLGVYASAVQAKWVRPGAPVNASIPSVSVPCPSSCCPATTNAE